MAVVIAVTSDQHARSTLGLCNPKGVQLDDGGTYLPSKAHAWMWDMWTEGWDMAGECAAKSGSELWWVNNGDLPDGDHHNTGQIASRNPIVEREIIRDILDVPLAYDPKHIFMVRGTEAHVGKEGCAEEGVARALSDDWPVERCPTTGNASWWEVDLECEGTYLNFLHHGRTGYREWTWRNACLMLAADITLTRTNDGRRVPDLAVRSHFHRHADSYDAHKCRVIQTPCFQLKTAHVYKVAAENLSHIGMIWIEIDDDHYTVHKHITMAKPSPIWRVDMSHQIRL